MTQLFLQILNLSIAASWLILAVIIVRALISRRVPKWISCCLWGLVAIRLLIPFSFESNLSLVPDREFVIEDTAVEESYPESLPAPPVTEENISTPAPSPEISQKPPVLEETVSSPEASTPVTEENISTSVPEINGTVNGEAGAQNQANGWKFKESTANLLGCIWLFGLCLMLIYSLISALLLKRRVALSVPCDDGVRKGEGVDSPFVFGIFRPRIYLPYGLAPETENCVIAHERAHLKRGDHIIKPFGFFVLSLYWFNPLVWVAYILLCRDIEFACDERVINSLTPEARKGYASALLDCAVAHRRIITCPVAFGETGVKERVKKTMSYKKPAFWIILCGILACVIVAILFLTTSSNESGESSADVSESSSADISADESTGSQDASEEASKSPYGETELNYIDGLISVEYADDEIIASLGVYDKYGAERDYNTITTVIFPKETLTEFAIYRIDVTDDWANSGEFIIKQKLYSQPELNTQKPLVAEIEVGDILPENVISFKTADGRVHYYAVRESNLDDSLNVFSVTPDGENGDNSIPETSEPEISEPEKNAIYITSPANGTRAVPEKDKAFVEELLTSDGWGEYAAVVPNFIIRIGETKYEYALDIGNINCNGKSKTLTSSEAARLYSVLTEMFPEYFEEHEDSQPETSEPDNDTPSNQLAPGNPIQKTHQTPETLKESSETTDITAWQEKSPITPIFVVIRDSDMSLDTYSDYSIIKKSGLKVWICTKDGKKVDYVYTNSKGVAAFEAMEGEYTFYFEGNDKYAPRYYHKTVKVNEVYSGRDWTYQYGSGYKRIRYPIYSYVEENHKDFKVYVTDAETGEPIKEACVTVKAASGNYEAYTDANGAATTKSLLATYDGGSEYKNVMVTASGYGAVAKDVSIMDNELRISLKKSKSENNENGVFSTANLTRITFYAYYGGGTGSEVPSENMAEIKAWLTTFTVGEKLIGDVPPGTNTVFVELEYSDGRIIMEGLDTVEIDGVLYYTESGKAPDCYYDILSRTSLQ